MDSRASINIDPTGPNSTSSSTEIYDVVVVGAGPVGLATAIGLCQRGIESILVIDQTRAFRSVGQVIDLLPNGLKALKALDFTAYEAAKEAAIKLSSPPQTNEVTQTTQAQKPAKSRQWVQRNLQGQPIQSISLEYDDWVKQYGEGRLSISWYDLQTALRNQLPAERVRINHRCVNVVDEPETGCVRVDCVSDGTEANPYAHWIDVPKQENGVQDSPIRSQRRVETSIRARIVVAADGINSKIRKILYRDYPEQAFAQPEYSGFAAVGCFGIMEVTTELLTELQEKFLENSPIATIVTDQGEDPSDGEAPRMMLVRRPGGSLGYLLHLALPLSEAKETSGSALIELAVQQLEQANFPESLKQVVQLSAPTHLVSRPYYIHRVTGADIRFPSTALLHSEGNAAIQPPWRVGRVVLAGDAAHGMPPLMAQGVNQGLEDALVIATLISRISDQQDWHDSQAIDRAFEIYERLRRPMMALVQKATIERPDSSKAARQEYEQQVYHRNIDQELEAALK